MYYLELTDNELKILQVYSEILSVKNENDKDTKELVESARNIFKKGNSRRRILPRLFLRRLHKRKLRNKETWISGKVK